MAEYFGRQVLNITKTCIPNHSSLLYIYTIQLMYKANDPQLLIPLHLWQSSHTWKTQRLALGVRMSFVNFISAFSSTELSNLVNKLETLGCCFFRIWDFSQTLTCQSSNTRLHRYPQHRLHPSLQTYQPAPSSRFRRIKTWTVCLKKASRLHTDSGIWPWLF